MAEDPNARRDAILLGLGVLVSAALGLAVRENFQIALWLYPLTFVAFAMAAGRLRWRGALLLAVALAAAWYAAFFIAAWIFNRSPGGICFFCTQQEHRNAERLNAPYLAAAGAAASLVACLITFAALRLLGPALRTSRALTIAGAVTLVVMTIAALLMPPSFNGGVSGVLLFIPWQLVYGAGLALLLWPHRPVLKAKA